MQALLHSGCCQNSLSTHDDPLLSTPIEFRALVGCFQYLTFTRPDISFIVNSVIQFMAFPHQPHLLAVNRILRYIKGSLTHERQYYINQNRTRIKLYWCPKTKTTRTKGQWKNIWTCVSKASPQCRQTVSKRTPRCWRLARTTMIFLQPFQMKRRSFRGTSNYQIFYQTSFFS